MIILTLKEPWFSLLLLGNVKIVGLEINDDLRALEENNTIKWKNEELGFERFMITKITKIQHYPSFRNFVESNKLSETYPSIHNIDDVVNYCYCPGEIISFNLVNNNYCVITENSKGYNILGYVKTLQEAYSMCEEEYELEMNVNDYKLIKHKKIPAEGYLNILNDERSDIKCTVCDLRNNKSEYYALISNSY